MGISLHIFTRNLGGSRIGGDIVLEVAPSFFFVYIFCIPPFYLANAGRVYGNHHGMVAIYCYKKCVMCGRTAAAYYGIRRERINNMLLVVLLVLATKNDVNTTNNNGRNENSGGLLLLL